MSTPVLISALVTDVIDDNFWEVVAPETTADTRAVLKSRILVSQRLIQGHYIVTNALTTRISVAGQIYVLYVSAA